MNDCGFGTFRDFAFFTHLFFTTSGAFARGAVVLDICGAPGILQVVVRDQLRSQNTGSVGLTSTWTNMTSPVSRRVGIHNES